MRTRGVEQSLVWAVVLFAVPVASAQAQIESGRVLDDSTSAPLVGSRVVLQGDTAGAWKDVETTRTDAQGLFQFGPHAPGVYRVALLGKKDPVYFGAIDTLAADSMQQREFRLPIVRRSAASAYLPGEVEHPAEPVSGPTPISDRSATRVASGFTETSVQFVVDVDGRVDPSTVRVTSTSDSRANDAAQQSLLSRRYRPATIGGIPVRQVVSETMHGETRVEIRRSR